MDRVQTGPQDVISAFEIGRAELRLSSSDDPSVAEELGTYH